MPNIITLDDYDNKSGSTGLLSLDDYDKGVRPPQVKEQQPKQEDQSFLNILAEKINPLAPENAMQIIKQASTMPGGLEKNLAQVVGTNLIGNILDQPQQLAAAGVASTGLTTTEDMTFKEAYKQGLHPSDLLGIKNEFGRFGVDLVLDPLNIPVLKIAKIGLNAIKTTKNAKNAEKIISFIEKINKTDPNLIKKLKEEELIKVFNSPDAVKQIDEIEKNIFDTENKFRQYEFEVGQRAKKQKELEEAITPVYKLDDLKKVQAEEAKAAFSKPGLEADEIIKKAPEKKPYTSERAKLIETTKPKREFLTAEEAAKQKEKELVLPRKEYPATRVVSPAETVVENRLGKYREPREVIKYGEKESAEEIRKMREEGKAQQQKREPVGGVQVEPEKIKKEKEIISKPAEEVKVEKPKEIPKKQVVEKAEIDKFKSADEYAKAMTYDARKSKIPEYKAKYDEIFEKYSKKIANAKSKKEQYTLVDKRDKALTDFYKKFENEVMESIGYNKYVKEFENKSVLDFKPTKEMDTNDAIAYGKTIKDDANKIETLKQKELELSQEAKGITDFDKKYELLTKKQLYREARETATETGSVGKSLREEKSGKEFAKGVVDAIKKDIMDRSQGIVANPYKYLDEYLNSAKLKLTAEERAKLIKTATRVAKQKLTSSEQKQKIIMNEFEKIKTNRLNEINAEVIEDAVLNTEYKGEKYAASINLKNLNTDDQVKGALSKLTKEHEEKLNLARTHGLKSESSVLKDIEVRKLADDLGWTVDDLLAKRKGKPFTEAEALASREITQQSSKAVRDAWQKYNKSKNAKDKLEALTVTANHFQILEAYTEGASTAGRVLRQYRGLVKEGIVDVDKLMTRLKKSNLDVNLEKLAEKLSLMESDDIVGINKLLRDVVVHNNWDKIFEFYINSILSNPTTHIANILSNSLVFATRPVEKLFAAGVDVARAGITRTPRERFFSELLPRHAAEGFGFTSGIKEGVRRAVFAWKNEMTAAEASKLDLNKIYGAIGGKTGRAIRTPGRSLMAADEFFKGINQTAMTHTLAVRKARRMGYKGELLKKKIAEFVQNPDVLQAAEAEALYRTFTTPLGKAGQKIADLRHIPGVRYIIPFVRTPLNIAKYGLERTPLGLGETLYKIAKGTLKKGDVSDKLGRSLMGSMIGYGTFMYALEGGVTGSGPTDRGQRDALRRTGWQPYSIKVGDTYYSYQRFEPVGMLLGTAADFAESFDNMNDNEKFDIATKIATSVGQNILNKTFMQGLSDAMNAITYPERYGGKWTQRFVSSFSPNVIAGTARALDPDIRQANTILEKIKSRTPILSEQLLPRLNLWGEPLKRGNAGILAFSPIYISIASKNPVDKEMVRLNMDTNLPGKTINGIRLSDKHYNEYVKDAGSNAKRQINRLLITKEYRHANDDQKKDMINSIIRKERTKARERIGVKLGLYDPTKSKSVYVRAQYVIEEMKKIKSRDERIKRYRKFKKDGIVTNVVKKELKKQGFKL